MSEDQDTLFGRLAVKNHMVTQEHIQRCLKIQSEKPSAEKIPPIVRVFKSMLRLIRLMAPLSVKSFSCGCSAHVSSP